MSKIAPHSKNADTRGAPLGNIAGLCFVLGEAGRPVNVKKLAEQAISIGIIESEPLSAKSRFPTRINHHIISLRALNLVSRERESSRVEYRLNSNGCSLYEATKKYYEGSGSVALNAGIREVLRQILAASEYVKSRWLNYFMPDDDYTYDELIKSGGYVTFSRVPPDERVEPLTPKNPDSGYRLISQHRDSLILYDKDRREIQHGLRRWTNEAFLTDDAILSTDTIPFAHQSSRSNVGKVEIESFIVNAWLDPDKDLSHFEHLLNNLIDNRKRGNRINIPDLIITLSYEYQYSKENIKEMLTALFYRRRRNYFFERGSKFLVENAFKLTNKDKPAVYYLKLEGSWRTSIVRFGRSEEV